MKSQVCFGVLWVLCPLLFIVNGLGLVSVAVIKHPEKEQHRRGEVLLA